MLIIIIALLVQLVERRSPKPDVEGSSPSGRALQRTRIMMKYYKCKEQS